MAEGRLPPPVETWEGIGRGAVGGFPAALFALSSSFLALSASSSSLRVASRSSCYEQEERSL